MSDLAARIEAAIQRVAHGLAPMRIPVDQTDVDIVLSDAGKALAQLKREKEELEIRLQGWMCSYGLLTGDRDALAEKVRKVREYCEKYDLSPTCTGLLRLLSDEGKP